MYFQTLDDKTECVGVYKNGNLHFDDIPSDLLRTWKYTGSVTGDDIEYASLLCGGLSLEEACPSDLSEEYVRSTRRMSAFYKSFKLAKIDFTEHCIFDLIPKDALIEFCEIKNKITQHVFENYEKPANYDFLRGASQLLYDIKSRRVNIDISDCKSMFTNTHNRLGLQKILDGSKYIDYNLFGTVTGRLAGAPGSFPILTMKKDFRRILKPKNDWFISMDYNGAEVRTVLSLLGAEQPEGDIHEWNIQNVFQHIAHDEYPTRAEAKVLFFGWLYNPDSDVIKSDYYDRDSILDKYYKDGYIETMFGRRLKVDKRRAFNYLIQSVTSDLVIDRAVAISQKLEGTKSFISHVVHDELVIDLAHEDRHLLHELRELFSHNRLDRFLVNLKGGKNYFDLEDMSI
jgi:hypothetical protein